jgi:MOSC domain-containing protein YiiM
VIETGEVRVGDSVILEPYRPSSDRGETVSLLEDFNLYYDANPSRANLERALNAPIAIRTRAELTQKLSKLS